MIATHAIPSTINYNARLLIKYELDVTHSLTFGKLNFKNYSIKERGN